MGAEQELVDKIRNLMEQRFGGSDHEARMKLFQAYDQNGDGQVDSRELTKLLEDAGIGNGFTRGVWVRGVMNKLDVDASATISYAELEAVFANPPPLPA